MSDLAVRTPGERIAGLQDPRDMSTVSSSANPAMKNTTRETIALR
jgi:hypothetical protein